MFYSQAGARAQPASLWLPETSGHPPQGAPGLIMPWEEEPVAHGGNQLPVKKD